MVDALTRRREPKRDPVSRSLEAVAEGETPPAVSRSDVAPRSGKLRLLAIGEGFCGTLALPSSGTLTIGRSENADVRVDDPAVSRKHAVLHVGERLAIQDLGSSNGLRVRDVRLEAHQTVEIFPGDAVDLGATTLVVQRTTITLRPRRLWTHGAFEARLEDECARAERSGASFAVVRVHTEGSLAADAVEERLGFELRSVDVVAAYGPDEYEVLLVDTPRERAEEIMRRVAARLAAEGTRARVGIACHPRDGRAPEELLARACAAVRGVAAGDEGRSPVAHAGTPAIVVEDGAMQRLHELVARIAGRPITVLFLGETGVGKHLLAERLHRASPRAGKPFLRLDCATLSESQLESELFGHERGSFDGAVQTKPGLLEKAQGGTVFLDHVGELPMRLQLELLRVLEERRVYRVGGLAPRPVDIRFVAATHRDLEAQVANGSFRQDLFSKLDGISLVVPPLRERTSEIEALARALAAEACRARGRSHVPPFANEAMALLSRYCWPGNVRELGNVIERAVLLCGGGPIMLEHLPVEKMGSTLPARLATGSVPPPSGVWRREHRLALGDRDGSAPPPRPVDGRFGTMIPTSFSAPAATFGGRADATPPLEPGREPLSRSVEPAPLRSKVGPAERARILDALERCAGNQTKAAKLLGISRRTLVTRLETYALPRPRKLSG